MPADAKSSLSSPNEAGNARSNIDHDLPCIGCGYNLRTLAADARCPECGRAVGESIRTRELRHADLNWLKRLSQGMTVFLYVGAGVLLVIGFVLILPASGAHGAAVILTSCLGVGILLYMIGLVGAMLYLSPDPDDRRNSIGRSRSIARSSIICCGVLLLTQLLLGAARYRGPTEWLVVAIAHAVFLAVAVAAGAWYGRQLAIWAGMPRLVNAAAAVLVSTIAVCILSLVLSINQAAAPPPRASRRGNNDVMLAALLVFFVVAALISGLIFCTRLKILLCLIIRRREKVESQ